MTRDKKRSDTQSPQKTIVIACEGKIKIPLDAIEEFQGELKNRSKDDIRKLKGLIVKYGFSDCFSIWQNEGRNWTMDGHGRKKALLELRNEGYEIPPLPADLIFAKNETEAKQKLLAINSKFGNITQRGLESFIEVEHIDFNLMNLSISKEALAKSFQNDSGISDKAATFPVIVAMNKEEYKGVKALKEKWNIKSDEKLVQELIRRSLQDD